MKRTNIIFLSIIVILTIASIVLYANGDDCGSRCDPHSFLNPFGYWSFEDIKLCPAVCAYTPHPLFYIFADLLILTIIAYMIHFIVGKVKAKHK